MDIFDAFSHMNKYDFKGKYKLFVGIKIKKNPAIFINDSAAYLNDFVGIKLEIFPEILLSDSAAYFNDFTGIKMMDFGQF